MMAKYFVQQLGNLLTYNIRQELLETKLREFSCARDKQLEKFIHEQAIIYERRGFSRTYEGYYKMYKVPPDSFAA
ncbi:MAG: hypothetical protein LBL86_03805 [Coriobacteriales bacterium]|jgi:hypothetical protein|nr:hypothetical protein [Coriobacteriales bacterium]